MHDRRLGAAALLNSAFGVVQVVAGLAIGSVVVLADAAHQAVDALGLITAYVAVRVARRPADHVWSFGLGKADALGGFVSGALLLGSVAWIVVESVRRLVDPQEVAGVGVVAIGVAAVVVNGVGVLLVGHRHDDDAVSLRAARLHLLTDLAGSGVVVVSGLLLALGGPAWIDPVSSLALSAVVLVTTLRLLRRAVQVLLDRAPHGCDGVAALIADEPRVTDVHHVHVRPLGGGRRSLTAHLVVDGRSSVHDVEPLLRRVEERLRAAGIDHTTLQVECHPCAERVHGDALSGTMSE